ncbi:MAG: cysteine desulfurase [Acetilactobacillus jinshanensis]
MIFKKINQVNGDTLRDVGFSKSNAGNFIMRHPLGINGPRLKIVVRTDLKTFKIDVTDNRGLRKVNIFDGKHQSAAEQFKYLVQNLILRKVLVRK